jgi:hypothetical protein
MGASRFAWGSPDNGQLGNGTDGKTLERAGKFTFNYVRAPAEVLALPAKVSGAGAGAGRMHGSPANHIVRG